MKALRFDRIGALDGLAVADVLAPEPGPGEVRVDIRAAGVNPSDVKNVQGRFPRTTVPRTPGRDFAGVVVDGPDELLGSEVWGSGCDLGFTADGAHAESVVVPAAGVGPKPSNLSFAEAASCGVAHLTAREALDRGGVTAGTRAVLIGAGAVGSAALALARARDARVVVAVRRAQQADELRGRGVDAVVLGEPESFADAVGEHFAAADVVFDTTGFWLAPAVPVLAAGGRVCVVAAPSDGHERVPVLDLYRRGGHIIGVNSLQHDTAANAPALDELRAAFESGQIPPPAGIVERPLAAAAEVYRAVAAGSRAKHVLTTFTH